ncbi:CopG family transcriptional regulator [Paenibacillus sp. FSL R5-0744]|uniref:CopG family transcriptional regulator n=1 Tax=Paenibacillus sp. FSL R5-0744 TaxID=2921656 RepID=UPI0030D6D7C6
MPDLEKVSINLGPVDLGQIDLLVDQGYYTNRTDFIRIAIKNQLDSHSSVLKELKQEKYFVVGIIEFDRNRLEDAKQKGVRIDINLVGGLIISDDVTRELAEEVFGNVKIFGIIRAPEQIKKYLRILQNSK